MKLRDLFTKRSAEQRNPAKAAKTVAQAKDALALAKVELHEANKHYQNEV